MDPVSAVLVVANLIAISDNIYRGLRFLRRIHEDPRINGYHVRLITERARYEEWKRRMGIIGKEDVEIFIKKIPESAQESLMMILLPMEKYLHQSQALMEKFRIDKAGLFRGKIGLKDKAKRAEFMFHGEKELFNLLETLKHCNDGLLTIAPPPPGYYVSLLSGDPIFESSQPTEPARDREHLQSVQTGFQTPEAQASRTTRLDSTSSISTHIVSEHDERSRDNQVFHPVIKFLFSISRDVLRIVQKQYIDHEPSIVKLHCRLSIWGSGMFQGPVTIDQALNQQSGSVKSLRTNIAQTLAEIVIMLERMLSALKEPQDSTLRLRLKSLFSIPEISQLVLSDEPYEHDLDGQNEESSLLKQCIHELSDLIECLFYNLPTIEMVFKAVFARQKHNPALDERKMILLKSESNISLSNMRSGPMKDLLKVDLELIAAMRESLKDTKYVEYLEQQGKSFDHEKVYKELGKESALVKYWTNKLAAEGNEGITAETQTAMTYNLARIARAFASGFEGYRSTKTKTPVPDSTVIQDLIRRCQPTKTSSDDDAAEAEVDSAEATTTLWNPLTIDFDGDNDEKTNKTNNTNNNNNTTLSAALDVLKSSTVELRRLAGSCAPEMSYQEDFALLAGVGE